MQSCAQTGGPSSGQVNEWVFDRMQDGHMKLAPRAAEQHKFDPDDRLVVISGSKFKNS